MKIGIIGTGNVGQKLGTGFTTLGHETKMGARDPNNEKLKAWVAASGKNASGGTFADAARFGDVVVLATLWTGTENAIKLADPANVAGKVVIDATNPLRFRDNDPPELALGWNDSGGEQVQRWLPNARVVKCFNIVGNALMFRPQLPGGPPDMFIAGNDEAAKKTVGDILTQFGWPPAIDIGGIEGARLLEPMCILWVTYAFRTGSWTHAFKLLHK